jgi:thioesterase domain-containing protein/aryl carrier-like protein
VLQRTVAGSLRAFLAEKFPDYMIPATYILLDRLPLTPSGKVDRRALPQPDSLLFEEEKQSAAPRDTLEMQLAGIWESLLGVRPIGIHDNFFECGGHSLLAVRLTGHIKQQLGREIALSRLFQTPTIAELARLLRETSDSDESWPILVQIQPKGSRQPMFWVHAVGGNVLSYVELARALGDDQPFYAFQSPGLDGKQEMLPTVEDMAECYLAELRSVQSKGPYQLGGWSFGGLVAFEMARRLQVLGEEVHLLALVDIWTTIAQHLEDPEDEAEYMRVFARYLSGLFGQNAMLLLDEDRPLTLAVQLPHIFKQAKLLNMLPPETDEEYCEILLAVFRNNMRAAARYTPTFYHGMALLFRAAEKPRIRIPDINLGWGRYIKGGIINHVLPGNHYSLLRKPTVEMLAEALESYSL